MTETEFWAATEPGDHRTVVAQDGNTFEIVTIGPGPNKNTFYYKQVVGIIDLGVSLGNYGQVAKLG